MQDPIFLEAKEKELKALPEGLPDINARHQDLTAIGVTNANGSITRQVKERRKSKRLASHSQITVPPNGTPKPKIPRKPNNQSGKNIIMAEDIGFEDL